jgi:hypothetical protein
MCSVCTVWGGGGGVRYCIFVGGLCTVFNEHILSNNNVNFNCCFSVRFDNFKVFFAKKFALY